MLSLGLKLGNALGIIVGLAEGLSVGAIERSTVGLSLRVAGDSSESRMFEVEIGLELGGEIGWRLGGTVGLALGGGIGSGVGGGMGFEAKLETSGGSMVGPKLSEGSIVVDH